MHGPSPPVHTVMRPSGVSTHDFSKPIRPSAIRLNMASTVSGRFQTIHTDAMIAMTTTTPNATSNFNNFLPISPLPINPIQFSIFNS